MIDRLRQRRAYPPTGPWERRPGARWRGWARRVSRHGVAAAGVVGALLGPPRAGSAAPDEAPATGPATPTPDIRSPVAAERSTTPRVLLLVAPDLPSPRITQIHGALMTELREVPAEVVIALDDRPQAPLPERILIGAAAARRTASIAALWIDVDGDDLVLGFLDPRTEEARLRRISGGHGGDATNLETAALITRESLAAMLQRPPPSPPPPVQTRPPAPPPRPRRVRLLIGYHGDLYPDPTHVDRSRRWQSGVDLQLAYQWKTGAYAGLGGVLLGALSLPAIPVGGDRFIDAKIRRAPIHAVAGYHRLFGRFGLDAEFAAGIDVAFATAAICDPTTRRCTTEDRSEDLAVDRRSVVTYGFAPRVRALFAPVADFFLFVGGGVDVFSDAKFYYRYQCTTCGATFFRARTARPVLQVGLLLRL